MEGKKRVYGLAHDMGVTHKDIFEAMQSIGITVKNRMQVLTEEETNQILNYLKQKSAAVQPVEALSVTVPAVTAPEITLTPTKPRQKVSPVQPFIPVDENGKLIFPATRKSILIEEFLNRTDIISVEIEHGVIKIEDKAFRGCSNLKSVIMPDSITYLGRSIFNSCTSLESVTFSNRLTYFNDSIFRHCTSLKSFTIPPNIVETRKRVFGQCSALKEVIFPETTKIIGEELFRGCDALNEIRIPENLTELHESVFGRCKNLKRLYLPRSITSILPDEKKPRLECIVYACLDTYAYQWMQERGYTVKPIEGAPQLKAAQSAHVKPTNAVVVRQENPKTDHILLQEEDPNADHIKLESSTQFLGDELFAQKNFVEAFQQYQLELQSQYRDHAAKNICTCIKELNLDIRKFMIPYLEQMAIHECSEIKYIQRLYELYRITGQNDKIYSLFQLYPNAKVKCTLSLGTVKILLYIKEYEEAQLALDDLSRFMGPSREFDEAQAAVFKDAEKFPDLYELTKRIVMQDPHCSANILNAYRVACLRCGHLEEAINMFAKSYQTSKNYAMQSQLIEMYYLNGQQEEANDIYYQMCANADKAMANACGVNKNHHFLIAQIIAAENNLNMSDEKRYSAIITAKFGGSLDAPANEDTEETIDASNPLREKKPQPISIIKPPSVEFSILEKPPVTARQREVSNQDNPESEKPESCNPQPIITPKTATPNRKFKKVRTRSLMTKVNKVNKVLRKYFNVYQGDESAILYSKSLFGSALLMIKHKFSVHFGNDSFEVTEIEKFNELFPIYQMMCFTPGEIVEVSKLLKKLEFLLTGFNPSVFKTTYKIGKNVSFLLSQKTDFNINGEDLHYVSFDPATNEITVFGLAVLLSTFMDKDEKQAYVDALMDWNDDYIDIYGNGLFALIPPAAPTQHCSMHNRVDAFFSFQFNLSVFLKFILETECYVVQKNGSLSPDRPSVDVTPFMRIVAAYFSYSETIVSNLSALCRTCKNGTHVGEYTDNGVFTVTAFLSCLHECVKAAQGEDKKFFQDAWQQSANYLFNLKYFNAFCDWTRIAGLADTYDASIRFLSEIHKHYFTAADEEFLGGFSPDFIALTPGAQTEALKLLLEKGQRWSDLSMQYYSVDEEGVSILVNGITAVESTILAKQPNENGIYAIAKDRIFKGWDQVFSIQNTFANIQWYVAKFSEKK